MERRQMQKKYRMLRIAASILRVLGWVVLVVGSISSIVAGAFIGDVYIFDVFVGVGRGAMVAILGIIYSIIVGIFTIAAAEVFYRLTNIEENTRRPE